MYIMLLLRKATHSPVIAILFTNEGRCNIIRGANGELCNPFIRKSLLVTCM